MIERAQLLKEYPSLHEVIAVSKTQSMDAIQRISTYGYTHFGENKAQELIEKAKLGLPFTWHFIGHLQTNKVKDVVAYASWIHSVNSLKLLQVIQKECEKQQKSVNLLIQVKLTDEESKSGCSRDELEPLIQASLNHPWATLKGLMVIGPNTENSDSIETVFKEAEALFKSKQAQYPQMTELSMGMTHDYPLAIRHSATMIRIGTLLFGERKKHD